MICETSSRRVVVSCCHFQFNPSESRERLARDFRGNKWTPPQPPSELIENSICSFESLRQSRALTSKFALLRRVVSCRTPRTARSLELKTNTPRNGNRDGEHNNQAELFQTASQPATCLPVWFYSARIVQPGGGALIVAFCCSHTEAAFCSPRKQIDVLYEVVVSEKNSPLTRVCEEAARIVLVVVVVGSELNEEEVRVACRRQDLVDVSMNRER